MLAWICQGATQQLEKRVSETFTPVPKNHLGRHACNGVARKAIVRVTTNLTSRIYPCGWYTGRVELSKLGGPGDGRLGNLHQFTEQAAMFATDSWFLITLHIAP